MNYGVFYPSSVTVSLLGYTNFDWEGNSDRWYSTSYLSQIGSGSISWSSKKVKTLALSYCEAEYRTTKEEDKELVWLHHVITDLGLIHIFVTELICDNQGVKQLSYDPAYHSKTKKLDFDAHYI
jgi:hypothetical protein